jgi:hypothetical protein
VRHKPHAPNAQALFMSPKHPEQQARDIALWPKPGKFLTILDHLNIRRRYRSGEVLSGEMKAEAIKCIQRIVEEHACARSKVNDDMLAAFMKRRPLPLPK